MKGTMLRGRRGKGFTLIELLVVIAIIGILAALLFPAVQSALIKGKAIRVGSDGRQIQLGLFSENLERVKQGYPQIWPSNSYASSTLYFKDCFTSNWLEKFTVKDIGASGLPEMVSTNVDALTQQTVAWCITVNCSDEDTPLDTPLFFTRNFVGDGSLRNVTALDKSLFSGQLGVVITFGGRVVIMRDKDFKIPAEGQKKFNPSDTDLPFVRP